MEDRCYICGYPRRDCVGHVGLPSYLEPFRRPTSERRIQAAVRHAVSEAGKRHQANKKAS